MRKQLLTITLMLGALFPTSLYAQHAYRPFLMEGKVWNYDRFHLENDGFGFHQDPFSLVVKGDTIIGNTTYKIICRQADGDIDGLSCMLREEGRKVFKLYPGESDEYLLFDFDREDIGTVESWKSDHSSRYVNWMITDIDTVQVGDNLFRRYSCRQQYSDVPLTVIEDGEEVKNDYWVEGVGSASGGILGNGLEIPVRPPGEYSVFVSCYEEGECIFSSEDFTKPAYTSTSFDHDEYESFLEEGKVWTISERVEGVRDPYFMNWEITLSGDTIIDGIHFKHRYRRAWNWDEEKPQEWVPSGCYGQKDGKTYLYDSFNNKVLPDMDFTLKVGDTFQCNDFGQVSLADPNLFVTEVSNDELPLFFGRTPQKCIYLQTLTGADFFTDVWVDGIGSLLFGIHDIGTQLYGKMGVLFSRLAKHTIGDEVLYDGTIESEQKVTIGGLKYCLYPDTHTAAIDGENTWSGELEIPTEINYDGDTYTVKGISHKAFMYCTELTKVKMPKTIDRIMLHLGWDQDPLGLYMNPFAGCTSLESIEVDADNPILCSIGGILFNKDGTRLYSYPGGMNEESYTVPDGVTWIGYGAFSSNENIVSIELPASVCDLCGGCFDGCGRLETVNLPESITYLGAYMFRDCSSLKSIEIPKGVKNISEQAFFGCTSLKVIDIPANVTFIGSLSFMNCSLDALVIRGVLGNRNINRYLFAGMNGQPTLYVQTSEIDRYKKVFSGTVLALDEYQTGIQVPTYANHDTGLTYDLQGRRVQGTPKKGVYIQSGKKVVIK